MTPEEEQLKQSIMEKLKDFKWSSEQATPIAPEQAATPKVEAEKHYVKTALFDEKKFRECIPPEMLAQKRWVRYFLKAKPEGNGTAKIPLGDHSKPETWSTFDECVKAIEKEGGGIGYCFLGGDIHGLDIDHCRNPKTGQICEKARELLRRLPSWAEFSVSGNGIHIFFKGNVRGKQLTETCLQYWNPKNSPRFFALTCNIVDGFEGRTFDTLIDIGSEFNYIFSTASHISAKIREELKDIDPEQWVKLPAEREVVEPEQREKPKTKSRKVAAGFDIKDFLAFYKIPIANETDNELGHCIRLTTCPIKGEPHVGQNSTTTNFIYPASDGGLGFKCQSTGCVDKNVHDAIKELEKAKGKYPKPIYENSKPVPRKLFLSTGVMSKVTAAVLTWAVDHVLLAGALNLFVGDPDIGKTLVAIYYMAMLSREGKKTVVICREDDYGFAWKPRLIAAGADLDLIIPVFQIGDVDDPEYKEDWMLDDPSHLEFLRQLLLKEKPALTLIDPLGDYAGSKDLNKLEGVRAITRPLIAIAKETNTALLVNAHTTKALVDSAIKAAAGSFQLMASVTIAWYFIKDPDNEGIRLMLQARNKFGKKRSHKYSIAGVPYPEDWQGHKDEDGIGMVTFKGTETRTADEMLERNLDRDNNIKTQIRRWVNKMLANGPVPTKQAGEEMNTHNFNRNTVNDVCREMGVVRDGKTWSMKKQPQAEQMGFDKETDNA